MNCYILAAEVEPEAGSSSHFHSRSPPQSLEPRLLPGFRPEIRQNVPREFVGSIGAGRGDERVNNEQGPGPGTAPQNGSFKQEEKFVILHQVIRKFYYC